jgi:hypothetical protein
VAQPAPSLLSTAEYLVQERAASSKHEFSHGQMVAMAGASLEHNVIVANVWREPLVRRGRSACAAEWQRQLDVREVSSRAEIARREGISRAPGRQILGRFRPNPRQVGER